MRMTIYCEHYRALSNHNTCEAGVGYEKFNGQHIKEWPCFCKNGDAPRPGCDLAKFPSPEELARQDKEDQRRFADIGRAREAILTHLGGPWKKGMPGASSSIGCPVCATGTLRFSRAGYNGHIHAGCTTPGCVSWME